MKTYLLNAVQRLKNYSQKLDAEAILFEKSWEVFNESGNKELMIFRTNKELLISRNGIVQKGKWELLDVANIIIDAGDKSYLFNAAYIEDKFLALKLDGTEEFMVMIEADMKDRFSLNTVKSIESYLDDRYKQIEAKKQAEIESQNYLKLQEAHRKREEERKRIEEENRNQRKIEKINNLKRQNPKRYSKLLREVQVESYEVKWELYKEEYYENLKKAAYILLYPFIVLIFLSTIVQVFDIGNSIINSILYWVYLPVTFISLLIFYIITKEEFEESYSPKTNAKNIVICLLIVVISIILIFLTDNNAYVFVEEGIDTVNFIKITLVFIIIASLLLIYSNYKGISGYRLVVNSNYFEESFYDEILKRF